jgi:hypothetical protein
MSQVYQEYIYSQLPLAFCIPLAYNTNIRKQDNRISENCLVLETADTAATGDSPMSSETVNRNLANNISKQKRKGFDSYPAPFRWLFFRTMEIINHETRIDTR